MAVVVPIGRYRVLRTARHPENCQCPAHRNVRRMEARLRATTGLVSIEEYQRAGDAEFPFPAPTMWDYIRKAGLYATEEDIDRYETDQAAQRNRDWMRDYGRRKRAMAA